MTGRGGSALLVAFVATASLLVSAPAVVEVGSPEHFFTNPQEVRTQLFLSQIL